MTQPVVEAIPDPEPVVKEELREEASYTADDEVKEEEDHCDAAPVLDNEENEEDHWDAAPVLDNEENEEDHLDTAPVLDDKENEESNVQRDPSFDSSDEDDLDAIEYKRVNTLHAEITVPLSAKSGDMLDIEHDGMKQITVPAGQQGRSITVKMISQKNVAEPETGSFCGCF